jgi:hypothetical protein
MKKTQLALVILAVSGFCFCGLSQRNEHARRKVIAVQASRLTQAQRLGELRRQKVGMGVKIDDLNRALHENEPAATVDEATSDILRTNGLICLSKETRRELLARLGFAWNSSEDYVLVHKAALKEVRPNLFKMETLADVPCALLALTPEERQQVEAAFAKSWAEFGAWARANLQREEPSGDTLVRFTIAGSDGVAQMLTDHLFSAIASIIGSERAELLGSFAGGWLQTSARIAAYRTNTLAVLRRPDRNGHHELVCQTGELAGDTRRCDASNLPPPWKHIFPGGWTEIAQRAGLDLPETQ